MIISIGIFFIFFEILIFKIIRGGIGGGGAEGVGKKWLKMTKNFVCLTSYLRNRISYDLVHMCKMMISAANIFSFQNSDFWGF